MSKDITDGQRREVARRLRTAHVADRPAETFEEYNDQNAEFVMRLAEALADADRGRLHHAPSEYDRRPLMDVLADLIDRPTCTPEVGLERQTCSECGAECIDGWANFCPNCGAEVVR